MKKIITLIIFVLFFTMLTAAQSKQKSKEESEAKSKTEKTEDKKGKEENESEKSEKKEKKKDRDEDEDEDIEKELGEIEEKTGGKTSKKETEPKKTEKVKEVGVKEVDVKEEKKEEEKKPVEKKIATDKKEKETDVTEVKKEKKIVKIEKKNVEKRSKPEKSATEDKKDKKTVKFSPYGFVEAYGWANDSEMVGNDLAIYTTNTGKSSTGISVRNTRLGVDISLPQVEIMDVSAKLEMDLFGNYADSGFAEASPMPRLRHGYFSLSKTFKTGTKLKGKFGQTWVTAIPVIFPAHINPAMGWGHGNVWQRLPLGEISVFQKMGKFTAGLKLGAARAISGASSNRNSFIEMNIDSGSASHMPNFQGLLSLKGEFDAFAFYVATGAAYGREDYAGGVKISGKGDPVYGDEVDVWLYNVGGKIVHKYVQVSGKYYIGRNLDMFGVFGGALTYDNNGKVDGSLKATGYWVQLSLTPFSFLSMHTGVGSEDPDNEFAKYTENKSFWFSTFYEPFEPFQIGFQWMQLQTFVSEGDGSTEVNELLSNSFMGSVRLTF